MTRFQNCPIKKATLPAIFSTMQRAWFMWRSLCLQDESLTRSLSLSLCLSPRPRSAPKASSEQGSSCDKKERPMSTMSEASNYTGGSDYSTFPGSPTTTVTTATTTSSSRVSLRHTATATVCGAKIPVSSANDVCYICVSSCRIDHMVY